MLKKLMCFFLPPKAPPMGLASSTVTKLVLFLGSPCCEKYKFLAVSCKPTVALPNTVHRLEESASLQIEPNEDQQNILRELGSYILRDTPEP